MNNQLYLDDMKRKYYIAEIIAFEKTYKHKIFPIFENIEQEADKFAQEKFEKLCRNNAYNEYADEASFAESTNDETISYYGELSIAKYQITATSISSLYHLWEQQIRKFLFCEISHSKNLDFKKFCCNVMDDIKERLPKYNIEIEKFSTYNKLNEHRLLTNVIKHGDGDSATKLRKINETLLKKNDFSNFLDTTFLEKNLNINQDLFFDYAKNIKEFWNELPGRAFLCETKSCKLKKESG